MGLAIVRAVFRARPGDGHAFMNAHPETEEGYFPIAREGPALSFERFCELYYLPERPVVIEGVAAGWPARGLWTAAHLRRALAAEPSATAGALWYWMNRGALADDYATPPFIEALFNSGKGFPRSQELRIWVHPEGNVSPWHYDTNMVNVFNAQVTGRKEWFLLSPETPPECYPFSFYAVIDGRGEAILRGRKHTRFVLNEGDMVYVPPCWFHKVISLGPENISLNWVTTNRQTAVRSPAMARELEIYTIQHYFRTHPRAWVRALFDRIYFTIPAFLRYRWRYDELIDTPYRPGRAALWKRVFRELAALGPTLRHAARARAALRAVRGVPRLEKPTGGT